MLNESAIEKYIDVGELEQSLSLVLHRRLKSEHIVKRAGITENYVVYLCKCLQIK